MQNLKSKTAISALAVLLITLPKDEGVKYTPYVDIAGVLTVCYGHTGRDVIKGKKYTPEECLGFLKDDTERHMARVLSCSSTEPTPNQLIGFTSFDFNTGGWCGSRSNREFNKGNFSEACRAMAYSPSGKPAWSYINGSTYVDGLHKRRIREMNMCNKGEA